MITPTTENYAPTIRELRIRRGASSNLLSDLNHSMEGKDLSSEAKQINFAQEHKGLITYNVPDLAISIKALQTKGTGAEVLLIHDMPVTEDDNYLLRGKILSLILSLNFGDGYGPMQFRQEKKGDVVCPLYVVPERALQESGNGQREFGHHTDFCHTANSGGNPDVAGRPNFAILYGIEGDGTATTYTPVAEVVEAALSCDQLRVLMEPRFETKIPDEMGLGSGRSSGPMSVIWLNRHREFGVSVRSSTRPARTDDTEAAEALAMLQSALVRYERRFVLQSGVCAIVSNIRGTHSRGEISNPGKRLVLRTYVGPLDVLREKAFVFDMEHALPPVGKNDCWIPSSKAFKANGTSQGPQRGRPAEASGKRIFGGTV
jgi:hypothetical protein